MACWGKTNEGNHDPDVSDSPSGTFRQISAAQLYNCGIRTGGAIGCWGTEREFPVMNPPSGDGYAQVATGLDYACALTNQGGVDCWGEYSNQGAQPPSGLEAK